MNQTQSDEIKEPRYVEPDKKTLDLFNDLFEKHHQYRLEDYKIKLMFCTKEMKSKGGYVYGRAKKLSLLQVCLSNNKYHGVVILQRELFRNLSKHQQKALIEHELCHFELSVKDNLTIVGHDVEEFLPIIRKYGMWDSSLERLQEILPFDKNDDSESNKVVNINGGK